MADARDVAKLFIDIADKQSEMEQGDGMTNLRLQKLLYYAQGWYMARYDVPLFEEDIEAWRLGPVVPAVYNVYRVCERGFIHDVQPEDDAFTSEEYGFLIDFVREYWKYSASELVSMSLGVGTPWERAYQGGKKHTKIDREEMLTYFKGLTGFSTFKDTLAKLPVVECRQSDCDAAIIPREIAEEWGDWDD